MKKVIQKGEISKRHTHDSKQKISESLKKRNEDKKE